MKRVLYVTLIFVLIFFISYAVGADKIKVKTVNGVQVIENPKNPAPPKGALTKMILKEELTIGEGEADEEMFSAISSVVVDDDGNIYMLDGEEKKVKVFDREGKFIREFGKQGQGPGEFSLPILIQFSNKGELVVEDPLNARIAFFTTEGKFLKNLSTAKALGLALIFFDSQGNIIGQQVVPAGNKLTRDCIKYDSELKPLFTFASMDNTSLLQGKINPFRIVIFYQLGKNDVILYSNPEEYEITVVNSEGELIKRILKKYDPVKVTEEDKKEFFDSLPSAAAPVKDRIEFPNYYPAYQNFLLDEQGRMFVRTYEKGKEKGEFYIDVFDAEGMYITKILLKADPRVWKGDKLYAMEENEDGFQTLKCYSIHWEK
ncbi:MAG: 6-bladed beta-propeller [Candidatus Aminicenantes bacterium]|nr:6-bladed beta-propeller [Candidatus Aminicenantes bacterium]MBL7082756.1 6-bladed beta-propeller [Candidatus Aminicenantes bacterium]